MSTYRIARGETTNDVIMTALVGPGQDMREVMALCIPETIEVLQEFEADTPDQALEINRIRMDRYYNDITDAYGNVLPKRSLLTKVVSWVGEKPGSPQG